MSKQVKVPEGAVRDLGELRWGRGWRLIDAAPESVTQAREAEIRAELVAVLPSIYKHFSDRLLSDEAKEAAIKGLSHRLGHTLNEAAVAVVLEETLQAASIPEVGKR